jgi:hypothetical protein
LESVDSLDLFQILVAGIFFFELPVTKITEKSSAKLWFIFGNETYVNVLYFFLVLPVGMNLANHSLGGNLFF